MFFRAIKAVISKQPEALNLSDFFILRFITSVLIFVVMIRRINRDFALKSLHIWFLAQNQPKSAFPWYSRMTVLSCQRSYTSKVLSPYCLRRLLSRSSCSWWGVSALCGYRRLGAAQFYRSCEQIQSAIAPSTDCSVKIMAHIRNGSHTRFVIRGSYLVFNEPALTAGSNYYLCRR